MNRREAVVKLAVGAMLAAATLESENEQREYEAWRKMPSKGKKRWKASRDFARLTACFEDLMDAGMDKLHKSEMQHD